MSIREIRGRIGRIREDERPENPKFSIKYMDTSADPGTDFYRYCNGSWIDSHPIPEDEPYWGASAELVERNRYILGKILEECAFEDHPENPIMEQVGAFYISAMDTETIENLKFEPIREFTDMILKMSDRSEIPSLLSAFHRQGIPGIFSFSSDSDEKRSSTYAYYLEQGGLSMPNRDYYLLDSFEEIRENYRKHIANMFVLFGQTGDEAENSSKTVFDIELAMAKSSRTPVELRDPERNYNRIEFKDLEREVPGVGIKLYLTAIGLPHVEHVVVRQPEFFENIGTMMGSIPLDSWKTYFTWKVLHSTSPFLHKSVVDENFDFFGRKLFGQPEQEKRWKRAVSIIDGELGEALGKLYVEREFGEDSKKRMETMVNDLKEVFAGKLANLDWMSEETKEKALEKFSRFRTKIGFPARFIDYSSIKIVPDDFLGNVLRSNAFEFDREIKRVNTPVDRELWEMTPPTVNAYFSPTKNEIVFPAGILQPPFFDPELDDAVNYGATGGTIAHEITHGFDDEGRKYDSEGNLNNWWSPDDEKEFTARAQSIVNLYNSLEALPGLHVNGELTLGENIADLGGVSIAYEALERRLARDPALRKTIDGFTPEQRFYIGWAQSWRANIRDEAVKWQISNDPHAPDYFRGEIPARLHYKFNGHFKTNDGSNTQSGVITIW